MRRRLVPIGLLGVCAIAAAGSALVSRTASANGPGLPDTNVENPVSLIPGDTTTLGIQANFGYLEAPDGKNFTWICHDVLAPSMSGVTPFFFRNSDGAFLATVRSLGIANDPNVSVFWSADGCTWSSVTGIDQILIKDLAFDPADPAHAYAVSASGGATPVPNGVFVSHDSGHSWSATSLLMTQRFFRTVRFAPGNPAVAYASASWFMPVSAFTYATTNGGVSWAERPWTFAPGGILQTNVDIAAVSPTNASLVYARTSGSTFYFLRSTNGGLSFSEILNTPAANVITGTVPVLAFAADGSLWESTANGGAYRSTDGVNFQAITSAIPPHIRGLASDARGVFVTANNYADGFALGVTTNAGASFNGLFLFNQITGVRACPAQSMVATTCGALFPALEQTLGISPTPSPTVIPTPGDKPGCKCDVSGNDAPAAASLLLGLVAAAGLAWRRRSR